MKMEIAVVGREEFVTGFRLAGVRKVFQVDSELPEDMEKKMSEVFSDKEVGILVVRDDDFRKITPSVHRSMVESVEPVVIAVGKIEEVDLRDRIKRVVGVDLWK
jgi:V/A-type H+-transporting ATPase subunit F